jgi:hypothetical protein
MSLLRVLQDFLVLELKSDCLKYLYSGVDKNRPEILDYGQYGFAEAEWPRLFASFEEYLSKIITEKLPAFKQLEAYLILPAEMVIPAEIRYFGSPASALEGWHDWELSQLLPEEDEGYMAAYADTKAYHTHKLAQNCCLAARNRHINGISTIMRERSLFLAGFLFPQSLWTDLAKMLSARESHSEVFYRDGNTLVNASFRKGCFCRLKRYPFSPGDSDNRTAVGGASLQRMVENLSWAAVSDPDRTDNMIYVFSDNFDQGDISSMQNLIGEKISVIPEDMFPPEIDVSNRMEYLLLHAAHKKIAEQWHGKDII